MMFNFLLHSRRKPADLSSGSETAAIATSVTMETSKEERQEEDAQGKFADGNKCAKTGDKPVNFYMGDDKEDEENEEGKEDSFSTTEQYSNTFATAERRRRLSYL
ncbi:hypothetical protein J437_LFUL005607 [Ladona fulva]|uniref:Uncharacterized protein n=1 Tax=Ladona fulva TaxID=123851 RepID=A0A8K0NV70_LADFU|nr:hypothetical protein J437_LFUL005607 [Ladona fulva]